MEKLANPYMPFFYYRGINIYSLVTRFIKDAIVYTVNNHTPISRLSIIAK